MLATHSAILGPLRQIWLNLVSLVVAWNVGPTMHFEKRFLKKMTRDKSLIVIEQHSVRTDKTKDLRYY